MLGGPERPCGNTNGRRDAPVFSAGAVKDGQRRLQQQALNVDVTKSRVWLQPGPVAGAPANRRQLPPGGLQSSVHFQLLASGSDTGIALTADPSKLCNPVSISHRAAGSYLTVAHPPGSAAAPSAPVVAIMAEVNPAWRLPILDPSPKHVFCAYSATNKWHLGAGAVTSGAFHLQARHTGMFCRVAPAPQFGGYQALVCDQRDISSAAVFTFNGQSLLHAGRALQVPSALGQPLVDPGSDGQGLPEPALSSDQTLRICATGGPTGVSARSAAGAPEGLNNESTTDGASAQLQHPHLEIAACAGADHAPWSQCTPVTIAHPTAGTLTASAVPVDPLADDLTHIVYAQPANSSIITRQLFCMYELNNEASVPSIANNAAYIFKNVHTQTFLSVVGGALAASAETGYVTSTVNAQQAAVPLLYVNSTLVSRYSGKALGVNTSSSPTAGMLVEDPGSLSAGSTNFTVSLYTGRWLGLLLERSRRPAQRTSAQSVDTSATPMLTSALQAGCQRIRR